SHYDAQYRNERHRWATEWTLSVRMCSAHDQYGDTDDRKCEESPNVGHLKQGVNRKKACAYRHKRTDEDCALPGRAEPRMHGGKKIGRNEPVAGHREKNTGR